MRIRFEIAECLINARPTPTQDRAGFAEANGRRNLFGGNHFVPRRRRNPQFGRAFLAGDIGGQPLCEWDGGFAGRHAARMDDVRPRTTPRPRGSRGRIRRAVKKEFAPGRGVESVP